MRIVQYVAYFPPHIGGLESHSAERALWRTKKKYGAVLVATYSMGQPEHITHYEQDGYKVVIIPAFEVIPTFPFPKFWKRQYRNAQKEIKQFNADIIITRTRFFIPSLVGGILAKLWGKKWVHIEHGVDYVELGSLRKNLISYVYDQTIGLFIFLNTDKLIAISKGCERFIKKFTKNKREISVIYRGLTNNITPSKNENNPAIYHIGYVGRLTKLKGVDILIKSLAILIKGGITNIHLYIVGDGEQKVFLEQLCRRLELQHSVTFYGYKDRKFLDVEFYPNIHIVTNASYQEGLPTSVIEGLLANCIVVATNVGGTAEISDKEDLLLVSPNNSNELAIGIKKAIQTYNIYAGVSRNDVLDKFNRDRNIETYRDCLHNL